MNSSVPRVLTAAENQAIMRVVQQARNKVRGDYSAGWPHFSGGKHKLGMHSLQHTDFVIKDALKVASAMGASKRQMKLTELTAAPHDVVQLLGDGKNEAASVRWVTEQLAKEKALEEIKSQLEAVVNPGITATRVRRVGFYPTNQFFSQIVFPSHEAEDVALCVCAGDFGRFFLRRYGPLIGLLFFCELQKVHPLSTPPLEKLPEFLEGQAYIAENWKFPGNARISSKKVEALVAPDRKMVTKFIVNTHTLWTNKKITTWHQLMEHTRKFCGQ